MGSLKLDQVSYSYPNSASAVLRSVSFAVSPHEKLSIVGGNLSGKTTLATVIVRAHLGQLEGTLTGAVRISFCPRDSNLVGFLFDDPNWSFCNLRVEDEVAFGLENLSVPPHEMRGKVRDALETVGLVGFESRYVSTLSGGELQKLAIAASLVTEPGVLVTDDLLANVDVASIGTIIEAIDKFRRRSECTWIDLGRHWPSDSISGRDDDRIAVLAEGRLLTAGTVQDVWEELGDALVSEGKIQLPESLEIRRQATKLLLQAESCLTSHAGKSVGLLHANPVQRFRCRPCEQPALPTPTAVLNGESNLRLSNVVFRYSGGGEILKRCDLEVVAGCVNVLAGRNGSGKTTLSRIAAGLLKEDSGAVFWKEQRADRRILRNKVSLVFQNPEYHFLCDKVADELLLTDRLLGVPKISGRQRTQLVLSQLGLTNKNDTNPFALTIGEKRRLAIGICVMRSPEVLVVDEPTLGQDQQQSRLLGELFRQLCREGITPLVVSHDARFIYEFGDVVHLLEHGQMVYSGAIAPLFEQTSKSDFAGKSAVLNTWRQICNDQFLGSNYPRSVEGLFSQVVVSEYAG
jgi:energy-coupling factor transport system ATP-binding protein